MFILKVQVKLGKKWVFLTYANDKLSFSFIEAKKRQFLYNGLTYTMYIYEKHTNKIVYNSEDYLLYNED